MIYCFGEFGNFYHHYLLSKLRGKGFKGHVIPFGGLFKFVSCPHYFCELLTWFGWMFITGFGIGPLLMFVVSTVILMQRSKEKHDKYKLEFNGNNNMMLYPIGRKALIPFVF